MPIYTFRCKACERQIEEFLSLKDFENVPDCCGERMNRVIVPPMIAADIKPYRSMIDGSMINSRSQHRQHLKDHGCVEIGNDSSLRKRPKPLESPPGLKETIIRAVNQHTKR